MYKKYLTENIMETKSFPLTALVLGVGGNVSQGILKALACSSLNCRVLGACTSYRAFGLYTTDRSFVSPLAKSPDFVPWLVDVCKREGVGAVLSGAEPVLDELALHKEEIRSLSGAVCIVNTAESMTIGGDKLATCQWLKNQGFPYPDFADAENEADVLQLIRKIGFPVIAKPRKSKGAAGVLVLQKESDLELLKTTSGYVVQELLGDENTEYTVACFTDKVDKVRGAIAFHRFLQSGTTIAAAAGAFPEVREQAIKIAERLQPRGPCNVQMRLHHGVPVCFEINVRFSGTTPIRARLGFNDVEAAIKHYVFGQPAVNLPFITSGQALRYWNEIYIAPEALAQAGERSFVDEPYLYPVQLENYGQRP
jgi:carbamoyl-phosphate synthase large subunit